MTIYYIAGGLILIYLTVYSIYIYRNRKRKTPDTPYVSQIPKMRNPPPPPERKPREVSNDRNYNTGGYVPRSPAPLDFSAGFTPYPDWSSNSDSSSSSDTSFGGGDMGGGGAGGDY